MVLKDCCSSYKSDLMIVPVVGPLEFILLRLGNVLYVNKAYIVGNNYIKD